MRDNLAVLKQTNKKLKQQQQKLPKRGPEMMCTTLKMVSKKDI